MILLKLFLGDSRWFPASRHRPIQPLFRQLRCLVQGIGKLVYQQVFHLFFVVEFHFAELFSALFCLLFLLVQFFEELQVAGYIVPFHKSVIMGFQLGRFTDVKGSRFHGFELF